MPREVVKVIRFFLLRVELLKSHPRIWRRVFVPAGISLSDLHLVIQTAMGWEGLQQWQFVIHQQTYQDAPPARQPVLQELVHRRGATFVYTCFDRDAWPHKVTLSNQDFDTGGYEARVYCVAGERACPPPNVGGIQGYYRFLQAIRDPEEPDHEEMLDSFGEFDPDEFYRDRINADLQRLQLTPDTAD